MLIRLSTYNRIKRFLPRFIGSDVARVGMDFNFIRLHISGW